MITEKKESKKKQEEREAKEFLLSVFDTQDKPRAYTILKSESSSGMSRTMKVVTNHNGDMLDITWWVAKLDVGTLTEKNGQRVIRVSGGGMDMGFHVVYTLSSVLYGSNDRGGYRIDHFWL
jgi:hypothetical protein